LSVYWIKIYIMVLFLDIIISLMLIKAKTLISSNPYVNQDYSEKLKNGSTFNK
jgi:uncharacterized protein YxeA